MSYNTRNYNEQGGEKLIIGGTLRIDGELELGNEATVHGMAPVRQMKWSAQEAVATDPDGIVDGVVGPFAGEEGEAPTVPLVITPTDEAFLNQPPCARNIVVIVAASTAGNIAAGEVEVVGKDIAGDPISEAFPVTADTAGTLTGTKAFAQIMQITIPVQDGDTVTFDVGWGNKLGLPRKLAGGAHHIATYLGASAEGTAPTFATSAEERSGNTIALSTALKGQAVETLFIAR